MTRFTSTLLAVTCLAVTGAAVAATPAAAASPSPKASCASALNQGGTPNGISQSDPGFLGQFVSDTATSGRDAVGGPTSTAADRHGDLSTCLAALGYAA